MKRVVAAVLAVSAVLGGFPAVARKLVPRSYRPLVMAAWFLPVSPVHNGVYPWPLFVYLFDPEDVTARAVIVAVVLTAGVVYGASYWLGRRKL